MFPRQAPPVVPTPRLAEPLGAMPNPDSALCGDGTSSTTCLIELPSELLSHIFSQLRPDCIEMQHLAGTSRAMMPLLYTPRLVAFLQAWAFIERSGGLALVPAGVPRIADFCGWHREALRWQTVSRFLAAEQAVVHLTVWKNAADGAEDFVDHVRQWIDPEQSDWRHSLLPISGDLTRARRTGKFLDDVIPDMRYADVDVLWQRIADQSQISAVGWEIEEQMALLVDELSAKHEQGMLHFGYAAIQNLCLTSSDVQVTKLVLMADLHPVLRSRLEYAALLMQVEVVHISLGSGAEVWTQWLDGILPQAAAAGTTLDAFTIVEPVAESGATDERHLCRRALRPGKCVVLLGAHCGARALVLGNDTKRHKCTVVGLSASRDGCAGETFIDVVGYGDILPTRYAAGLPAVRALLVEVEVEKTSMVVMEPEVAPEGASTIAELRMLEWSQRAQVAIKIAKAESESMDKARWLFDADWLDTAQRDWAAAAKYVCLCTSYA